MGATRVLAAGETPEHGVYPMPDVPPAVRAVLTVLLATRLLDNHVCEWPDNNDPGPGVYVDHCNCGGMVRFAEHLVDALGLTGELDQTGTVEELRREVWRLKVLQRQAARHARQCDVDVAEADAKAAQLEAEAAALRAQLRRTELELHDAKGATG